MSCKYYKDEFCVNDKCPYVADYCPVVQDDSICKFREERGKAGIGMLKMFGVLTQDGKISVAYEDILTLKE